MNLVTKKVFRPRLKSCSANTSDPKLHYIPIGDKKVWKPIAVKTFAAKQAEAMALP
jgi:hypothetical protein